MRIRSVGGSVLVLVLVVGAVIYTKQKRDNLYQQARARVVQTLSTIADYESNPEVYLRLLDLSHDEAFTSCYKRKSPYRPRSRHRGNDVSLKVDCYEKAIFGAMWKTAMAEGQKEIAREIKIAFSRDQPWSLEDLATAPAGSW